MKDLGRHIEYLLASYDEVAVPGLCTFVSENKSARYIVSENTFLPPYRSVYVCNSVNPEDTKLEDCIMKIHHVRRNIATQWIYDYAADIRSSIIEQGSVEIGTIGELSHNSSGYMFSVCDSGINSPVLYGLDTFLLAKLQSAERKDSNEDTPRITISLKRSTIQRTLSAAAVIFIAFILFVPQFDSWGISENARLFSWNTIEHFLSKARIHDNIVVNADDKTSENAIVATTRQDTVSNTADSAKENNTEVQAPTGYCVVMASAITDEMADIYVQKLRNMGLENAMKIKDGKMIRVILAGYGEDSSKAYKKVNEIRNLDPLFAQIWVMAL